MNVIKHTNIIYMPHISELGGIETYVYEMVKKYKDLDIAVVSKQCDKLQAKRIKKYCRLYIHTNEQIECKVAIINYDTSIIDYINKDAKIYEVIHGDYSNKEVYKDRIPPTHNRITGYIAITEYLQDKVKELICKDNVIMSYNPLTIEKEKKPLILVSATRLHENKGVGRMQKLATALDNAGINYIWYVISNDLDVIESSNVIFIKNRLDITKWLIQADYVVLLSDSEACSYTINEALYRNIPVIVTPLPYLKEIGVEDGKNSYIMNFDCSNIDEIVKKVQNVPSFNFTHLKDNYNNILAESKSRYKEEKFMYEVEVIEEFTLERFNELKNIVRKEREEEGSLFVGDKFECSEEIKDYLTGDNPLNKTVVKVLREIKEEKKEELVEEVKPKNKPAGKKANTKKKEDK